MAEAQRDEATDAAFRSVSATYDAEGLDDPYPLYAEARRNCPVMEGDILARFGIPSQADYANRGRRVFSAFRHADVRAVLQDDATWSTDLLVDGLGTFLGEMFLTARDGRSHRLLRGLLQTCFAPEAVRRMNERLIKPMIEREFGAPLRARGRAELLADLALPFPIRTIYTVLGFPDDPASAARFADQALRILNGPQVDPAKAEESMARAFQAADELDASVQEVVRAKRKEGADGDDMIARLIRAEMEGVRLSDVQIAGTVRMMLPAAAETTTRTLANLMVLLLERPDALARVRADRTLLPKAVTETMRLETVAGFLARRATRDTELGGVAIPEGAAVSLVMGSANRDEAVFDDPDTFNLDRPFRPSFGFGHGVHMCIGMPVAKLELEAAANLLLDLPGLRLDPERPAPRMRGLQFRGPDAVHLAWDIA
jgi:cytochrome P450